MSFFIV